MLFRSKHFSATVPDGYRGGDWMTVELASYTLMPSAPGVGRGYHHAAPARAQASPAPFQMQDREQQLTETHVTSLHASPTPGAAEDSDKASGRASAAVDALVRLASAAQAASDAKRDAQDDARDDTRVWNALQADQKPRVLPGAATSPHRNPSGRPSGLEAGGKRRLVLQTEVLHLEHVLHQEQEENEVKELEQRLQAQLAHARQASAERKQRQEEAQQEQAAQRKKARLRRQVQALRTRLLAQVAHLELAQKAAAAGLASGAVPSQAHGADQSLLQPQHQHQLPKQQHEQQLQAQIQRLQHTLGDREEALQKRLQNHRAAALSPSPHSPSAAAAAPQAAPVSSNKAAAAAAALRQADERVKRETHVLHTLEQQADRKSVV